MLLEGVAPHGLDKLPSHGVSGASGPPNMINKMLMSHMGANAIEDT